MDLSVIKQSGSTINERRDYRKGNWTFQETMVLLEAKKMDDERRLRRLGDAGGGERGKPPELRWKWVEDYCWRNGCFRSQNQCNDKWDNLMRDFKKVREYEGRIAVAARGGDGGLQVKSYWKMEKNERKEKNLPSNMVPQIYEALVEVVERKGQRAAVAGSGAGAGSSGANIVPEITSTGGFGQHSILPSPLQKVPIIQAPLPPPPVRKEAEPPINLPFSQPLPTVDSDTSEYSGSPAKRRKRRDGEGTSGTAGGTSPTLEGEEVGSAISKSASMIAETIQKCQERGERRHREMVNLHERRLRIEESKAEINRQGINGLVDAINNLSNSILAFATNKK